jgi:hypothetical protein
LRSECHSVPKQTFHDDDDTAPKTHRLCCYGGDNGSDTIVIAADAIRWGVPRNFIGVRLVIVDDTTK